MRETYEIPQSTAKVLIDAPKEATKAVVLALPGISGGVFSDRYQPLVDAVVASGFAIARLNIWDNEEQVLGMTIDQIQQDIDRAVAFLQGLGYTHIAAVGKSFGGGMVLANTKAAIVAKVLWAPAIGVVDTGGTLGELRTQKLQELRGSLLDITLDRAYLAACHGAVCLIHGTADNSIPFANSQKLQATILDSVLVPIDGADHSYRDKAHEAQVIEHTVAFIHSNVR